MHFNMITLKKGNIGKDVERLQDLLNIQVDGDFGIETEEAVKVFQKKYNLTVDGVVGPVTWGALVAEQDTDLKKNIPVSISFYKEYLLSAGNTIKTNDKEVWIPNYYPGPVKKQWLVLHHTAGWDNPTGTVNYFSKDLRTVATEWIVGGCHIDGINTEHDGKVLKCMPDGSFAWHLTIGNNPLHRESIGVEICGFGGLTKKNDKYYTWVNDEVDPSQVCDIGFVYRGNRYFHKYSDEQIEGTKNIILYTQEKYGINMKRGLQEMIKKDNVKVAFDFCDPTVIGLNPGLYTHGNVYNHKNDIFPQQEMVDMIMSI